MIKISREQLSRFRLVITNFFKKIKSVQTNTRMSLFTEETKRFFAESITEAEATQLLAWCRERLLKKIEIAHCNAAATHMLNMVAHTALESLQPVFFRTSVLSDAEQSSGGGDRVDDAARDTKSAAVEDEKKSKNVLATGVQRTESVFVDYYLQLLELSRLQKQTEKLQVKIVARAAQRKAFLLDKLGSGTQDIHFLDLCEWHRQLPPHEQQNASEIDLFLSTFSEHLTEQMLVAAVDYVVFPKANALK